MRDLKPASRLRVERVRAGWGLKALAEAVGLKNRSSLYRIENGVTKQPRPEIRKALAKALGAKEADLFRLKK
jgi:transcriptional regulator with XRE-family HTH domain